MNCPVDGCYYDLEEHLPIKLNCNHCVCRSCALQMHQGTYKIICPVCNVVKNFNNESELEADPFKVNQLKADLVIGSVDCFFHDSEKATKLCPVHRLPLCDHCRCVRRCELEAILPNPRPALHYLILGITDTVQRLGGPNYVPQKLRNDYERRFDPDITVRELCTLYRNLLQGKDCCFLCFADDKFGFDTNLELCCRECFESIETFRTVQPLNTQTVTELVGYVREQAKSLHFWLLSKSQLSWLRSPERNLAESVRMAKSILSVSPQPMSTPTSPILCPACCGSIRSPPFILPCSGGVHVICQSCHNSWSRCPLDLTPFQRSQLIIGDSLVTSCEVTEIEPQEVIPADDFASTRPVAQPARKRVAPDHPLFNRGKPIPEFISTEDWHAVERYLRVLPEDPLHYQPYSFEDPWYVNRHSNQVEALTFTCFSDVHLRGIGMANPCEFDKVVMVSAVQLYTGMKATGGNFRVCELHDNILRGGDSVITNLIFKEPQAISAYDVYTLKLKLKGGNALEKVAMYHGNHIGRYEDLMGTDSNGWSFERTEAVEPGEKNSDQQELLSPILRLIYS